MDYLLLTVIGITLYLILKPCVIALNKYVERKRRVVEPFYGDVIVGKDAPK